MHALRLTLLLSTALLSGCATLGYYGQAIGGQLDILGRTRPISELLDEPAADDPPLAPQLRTRLATVLRIRAFASQALALPDNGSYTVYADLERPAVAWNVIAAPEFSLTPRTWCYPFAGCVPYRGYFSDKRAERYARQLRRDGLDVRIARVDAYSTLGWFRDPVLNTHLRRDDAQLAALLFHELAHQVAYVPGDAAFNESLATAVEIEGLRRWLDAHDQSARFERHRLEQERHAEFVALVLDTRARLAAVYAAPDSDDAKRAAKRHHFEELRASYAALRARWDGDGRYDHWFAQDLNNAHLATVELYHQHVPAFQALLAEVGGDWPAFHRAVRRLSRLPGEARNARLAALASRQLSQRR